MINLKDLIENGGMMFMLEKDGGVHEDDEIVIPQIGRMTFKQLKKNIEGKTKDLNAKIKRGEYDKITDSMLEVLSHLIRVARAYKEGTKVPLGTSFK